MLDPLNAVFIGVLIRHCFLELDWVQGREDGSKVRPDEQFEPEGLGLEPKWLRTRSTQLKNPVGMGELLLSP